jgi:hypothetical protein
MQYHYFDNVTGQYLGTFEGEHCPSNATTTPPPEQSGAWFWDGGAWVNEPQGELPEPTQAEVAKARRQAILAELELLDRAAVRPLRAVAAGTATPEDTAMIAQIEANALALRDELAGLEAS